MKNSIFIISTALIIAFSSCKEDDTSTSTPVTVVKDSQATIKWQECAFFAGHDITVCFVDAKEGRCPCNTDCLWEGSVDATLHVTSSKGIDTTITLTTNSYPIDLPNSATVGGKTITFVNTEGIECADYGNYEKYKVVIMVQ